MGLSAEEWLQARPGACLISLSGQLSAPHSLPGHSSFSPSLHVLRNFLLPCSRVQFILQLQKISLCCFNTQTVDLKEIPGYC
jgi:hypothetical protein